MMAIKQVQTRPMPKNLPLEIWYRKKLVASVRAMAKDLEKSVEAQYKRKQPRMATDASPAVDMAALLRHMRYKWKNHFSKLAKTVPKLFAKRAERDASSRLKSVLKECGFTVDFKLTPRLNDILQSSIAENVGLIKTIQSQYFDQIETIVMQAVKNGRDLGYLHKELRKRYGVSEGRATVIARDQTNKANEAVSRERTLQTGLTKATWFHIGGKYSDRSTHAKMHGKEFDLREGLYDSAVGRDVLPAELINCNCSYRIVVPDIGQEGGVPLKDRMDANITAINKPTTKAARELQSKRDKVRNGVMALLRGVREEITFKNLRNDLEQYGGTNHITIMKGNKKKGLEHIIKNGREHYLGAILDAVIEGKIDTDYNPRGGQKIRLNHGNYQAVLVLEDKTWALTGWDIRNDPNDEKASLKWKQEQKKLAKDEKYEWHTAHNLRKQGIFHSASLGASTSLQASSDEKGKVRTRHLPTQTEPILSRRCLGADASLKDMVRAWRDKVK